MRGWDGRHCDFGWRWHSSRHRHQRGFSLTISCAAGTAGVLASGGTGIFINAATTDVVTLRGFDIDGQGTGGAGVSIISAKSVHVENCTIRNFRNDSISAGIFFNSSVTIFLFVTNTVISDNYHGILFLSSAGFKVASLKNVTIAGSTSTGLFLNNPNVYVNVTKSIISGSGSIAVYLPAASTTVNIDRSTIANNGAALQALASGSTIRISGNNIFNNTFGFFVGGGAQIQTDNTNNTGGSNGGATVPNASLAKN